MQSRSEKIGQAQESHPKGLIKIHRAATKSFEYTIRTLSAYMDMDDITADMSKLRVPEKEMTEQDSQYFQSRFLGDFPLVILNTSTREVSGSPVQILVKRDYEGTPLNGFDGGGIELQLNGFSSVKKVFLPLMTTSYPTIPNGHYFTEGRDENTHIVTNINLGGLRYRDEEGVLLLVVHKDLFSDKIYATHLSMPLNWRNLVRDGKFLTPKELSIISLNLSPEDMQCADKMVDNPADALKDFKERASQFKPKNEAGTIVKGKTLAYYGKEQKETLVELETGEKSLRCQINNFNIEKLMQHVGNKTLTCDTLPDCFSPDAFSGDVDSLVLNLSLTGNTFSIDASIERFDITQRKYVDSLPYLEKELRTAGLTQKELMDCLSENLCSNLAFAHIFNGFKKEHTKTIQRTFDNGFKITPNLKSRRDAFQQFQDECYQHEMQGLYSLYHESNRYSYGGGSTQVFPSSKPSKPEQKISREEATRLQRMQEARRLEDSIKYRSMKAAKKEALRKRRKAKK